MVLIEAGVSVAGDGDPGYVLLAACRDCADTALLLALIERSQGAAIASCDSSGFTVLHSLAFNDALNDNEYEPIAAALLRRVAKINAAAHSGITPLYAARGRGRSELEALLLRRGGKE